MLRKKGIRGTLSVTQPPQRFRGFGEIKFTPEALVEWLNGPDSPARKRVGGLLAKVQSLAAAADLDADLSGVNAELGRHLWRYQVVFKDGKRLLVRPITESSECDANEALAISFVVELAGQGRSDSIRRCQLKTATESCSAWFYAQHPGKNFCSTAHQQKSYRENPEIKQRRRQYFRDYYRNELSPRTRRSRKRKP